MTPKEEKEKIAKLEQELAKVIEQRDGLAKRVQELEAVKPASKSRQQAEAVAKLLSTGPVSQAQLKEINSKYPSDPVYYCRTLLKMNVHTVRREGTTFYMNDEHFKLYSEGLKKEAEEKKTREAAAKAEATPKEAPRQASPKVSPAVAAGATKTGARAAVLA